MISRTLLSGLVLLAVPGVARAQDCADLVAAVDQVSAALATVELEQAQVLADGALQQLECQPEPINPLVLASLFQLKKTPIGPLFYDGAGPSPPLRSAQAGCRPGKARARAGGSGRRGFSWPTGSG